MSEQQAALVDRCADCHRTIDALGFGHLAWCPFSGYKDFPRLHALPVWAQSEGVDGLERSQDLAALDVSVLARPWVWLYDDGSGP